MPRTHLRHRAVKLWRQGVGILVAKSLPSAASQARWGNLPQITDPVAEVAPGLQSMSHQLNACLQQSLPWAFLDYMDPGENTLPWRPTVCLAEAYHWTADFKSSYINTHTFLFDSFTCPCMQGSQSPTSGLYSQAQHTVQLWAPRKSILQ